MSAAQVDPLQPRVLGSARDPAALGDRAAVDLLQVAGEIDRGGIGDGGPDRERVDRRLRSLEVGDPIEVKASRYDDLHMLMPSLVEPGADLLDQVGGDPAAFRRSVEPHPP